MSSESLTTDPVKENKESPPLKRRKVEETKNHSNGIMTSKMEASNGANNEIDESLYSRQL